MKKFLARISVLWEAIKGFVIAIVATILIIAFTLGIAHNLLKINELSSKYHGEYKNLVKIEETTMVNFYTVGDGAETIVIMPGFGIQSPVLFYKELAKRLAGEGYKVVIYEPLGYGFSTSAKTDRTATQMAHDLHNGLQEAGIGGPYILMPHSISSLYAMKFAQTYMDQVSAIVSIDGIVPGMYKEAKFQEYLDAEKTNVNISSIAGLSGYERILSYVKPEMFYIDYMTKYGYSGDDINLYRAEIAINYLDRSMVKEIDRLKDNVQNLQNFKYLDSLPVVQIVTTDTIEEYDAKKKSKEYTNDYKYYSNQLVTNSYLQRMVIVEGDHMIPITDPDKIVNAVKENLSGLGTPFVQNFDTNIQN